MKIFAQETSKNWLEQIPNPISSPKLVELVDLLVRFIPQFGIPLATVAILVGGYFLLSSAGDENKVRSGKKIILISAICLIFIFLLKLIRDNIINFFIETFR